MRAGTTLAADYPSARARFLAAARSAGGRVDHHVLPEVDPDGGELAADVAWFGPDDASDLVLVVSGTHGVEGYAGSMCQSRWLEAGGADALRPDLALVFVHAINPYGFAWVRRVNEDNVDLNRNFCDLADPPANLGYDALADALAPAAWTEASEAANGAVLLEYAAAHGMDAIQAAVSGGQYQHPAGLFYGGAGPVWSHRLLRELAEGPLGGRRRVVVLDLHTGLGERGEVELITHERPGTPAFDRARAWWGERVASNHGGESVSAPLTGEWMMAAADWLAPAEVTAIALEWGTVDSITVLQALRADNWLHHHGDPAGPGAVPVKAQLRAAFAPDEPDWADAVAACFDEVVGRTLTELAPPA